MTTPANQAAAGSSYNYYPHVMVRLCAYSYDDPSTIPGSVAGEGLTVSWGPAQLVDSRGVSYSLAYVAHRSDPDEYTVVIRGTPPDSLFAFITEDFEIHTLKPFTDFVPSAPPSAMIAKGTSDGINDLLQLTDPATGASLLTYLGNAKPTYLYVTGHSLGGTLCPAFFAYLNYALYGGGFVKNMALWSFAGLTAGNGDFNTYLNSLFNPAFPWRLYNTLDVAPLCWGDEQALETIYDPTYPYGEPESTIIGGLFDLAAGNGYAQPQYGGTPLPGTLEKKLGWKWTDEASHQHQPSTYKTLVNNVYPYSMGG
jgi:triacylglycerol lipase